MSNSENGALRVKWTQSDEMTFLDWVVIARRHLLTLWAECSKVLTGRLLSMLRHANTRKNSQVKIG